MVIHLVTCVILNSQEISIIGLTESLINESKNNKIQKVTNG